TLASWLLSRLRVGKAPAHVWDAWIRDQLRSDEGSRAARERAAWLCLALDRLLVEYRWGPAYTWPRLLAGCWQHLAASPRQDLRWPEADRALQPILAEHTRQLCQAVPRTAPLCIFLGRFFDSGPLSALVHSTAERAGVRVSCVPAQWAQWLAPRE